MAFCQFQNTTSNGVVSSVFTMKKEQFHYITKKW